MRHTTKPLALALAILTLAPSLAAADTDPVQPVLYAYQDVNDAAFDAAGDGQELATGTYTLGHDLAFAGAEWGQETATAFYSDVQRDAFDAAANAQDSATGQYSDAHDFAFDRAEAASTLAFQSYGDAHAAGFNLAGGLTDSGFDAYGDAHGSGFDAAEDAQETGIGAVGGGQEAVWEAHEGTQSAGLGAGLGQPVPLSGRFLGAGNGAGRRGTPPGLPDPYNPIYFSGCADTGNYKVIAFSKNPGAPHKFYESGCTQNQAPIIVGGAPRGLGENMECVRRTGSLCFWLGVEPTPGRPNLSQFSFKAANWDSPDYGLFYLVRLFVGSFSIDFEVNPDDRLPSTVTAIFGTGGESSVLPLTVWQWSGNSFDVRIETQTDEGVPALFAVHANLPGGGYDVQFGMVWDGERLAGVAPQSPYTAHVDSSSSGGEQTIGLQLDHKAQPGNHVVFGVGPPKQRHADFALDLFRPPTLLDATLRIGANSFIADAVHTDSPMSFEFMADVLGDGRVAVEDVADLAGLEVLYAPPAVRSGVGDPAFCDAGAAGAYARHAGFSEPVSQVCIALASLSRSASIGYKIGGASIGSRGLRTAGNLALTVGPGSYIGFQSQQGSVDATVEGLAAGEVHVNRVVANALRSFWYVGGPSTWELHGAFGPTSVVQIDVDAPGLVLRGEGHDLGAVDVEAFGGSDPLLVRIAGNPLAMLTSLVVEADVGDRWFHFDRGQASLLRLFEFRTRSGPGYDVCDWPGDFWCFGVLAATVALDPGGSIGMAGRFYVPLSPGPDLDGTIAVTFDRDTNAGDYHAKSEPGETWCANDDFETVPAGSSYYLEYCGIAYLDFYTRR